ncbi:MAG: divJ [Phenylobacterium sp.]|nr:divJ [Phenylobacterium sp.]
MTQIRRSRRPSTKRRSSERFAVGWHLGWAATVVAAAGALLAAGRLAPGPELAPLAAGLVPALVGAALASAGERARRAALVLWALGAVVATMLTGGAVGPLAAWCLAPLAAAAAYRRPELLPLGAAGAVAAAAVAALSSALLPLPIAPAAAAPWLSLLAVGGEALALGAALVALHAEFRRELRARDDLATGMLEVLDNQPQLLLGLYPGGRILEAFGQPPPGWRARDLIDRNLGDFVHPDDRARAEEALHRAVSSGSAEAVFRPAHDADGWWELSLRRMSSTRIVGAVRDARAQRAREAELEGARVAAVQQNQGKSRFLANMSHELRTPLNAIMGFSDIMRQRLFGPISDRYAEYAELVHESGAHLLELINDVLDMSKIEADRFELAREGFDPRDPVSAALRLMRGQADRAGVSLRGVLPAEPMAADADRRAVKQIAINLLSNALKFTPRGGAVTLTLQPAGEMLELIVADTGVGIAPDDLERLGRPFEQAGDANQRVGGSGLGLSLVRAFAQLHGGEMCIESTLGEGATVIVRMPVLVPLEAPAARPLAAEA